MKTRRSTTSLSLLPRQPENITLLPLPESNTKAVLLELGSRSQEKRERRGGRNEVDCFSQAVAESFRTLFLPTKIPFLADNNRREDKMGHKIV